MNFDPLGQIREVEPAVSQRATVHVVDPDGATRSAIRDLVTMMGLHCATYASGEAFLEGLDPLAVGCVVLEIRIPGINGLQIQKMLEEGGATLPVIFLCGGTSVSMAVHAIRAGAVQFFEKPFRELELWAAIQEAIQVGEKRRTARLRQQETERRLAALTAKEQLVLEMVSQGKTKRAIAAELGISVRTVEHYRTQLIRKLETGSPAGLLYYAMSLVNDGNGNGRLTALR